MPVRDLICSLLWAVAGREKINLMAALILDLFSLKGDVMRTWTWMNWHLRIKCIVKGATFVDTSVNN